jgi:hypothetical protein
MSAQDVASDRRSALDHLQHMISQASNAGTFHDPPPTAKQTRLPNQSSTYRTNEKTRDAGESMKKVSGRLVLTAAGM